ncbi:uncharacterized protein LOC128887828 isoform X1 [Hylaeus anthracinus]|uniref:uncharacterized protein LOC128887828 isoform X1 n=1 Tax=Hylaeus anthracinus TaxID=313031 RepID=UPI0023B98C7C|nr:uncharacterized protein LOC128887828 isoform X1 [Hylaeus anthracinus]XP_054000174.1 uncharacterized protein LOC128887828 isoform X1 [Hylaeus anthracinus]
MGVPRVETRRMISRGVGDRTVPPRSSNRSPQGSATVPSTIRRSRTPSSTRAFLRGRSMLWIVFAIQLIGAPANSDKTGDIEVEIKVPSEAKVGSSVELGCEWRLFGRSGLYSVKWYKDDHEFFRYVPEYNPRIQTFPQPGVNIDKKWKNEKSIRLRDLGVTSSGQYKCEVSTEAPSFATTYRTANLTVIALPERGPEITGLSSSHYAVGEDVTANCTVWPSVPKAALRWVINGKPIASEKTIQYPERGNSSLAATPTSLGLRVELEPGYLGDVNGATTVLVKCIAQIGSNALETEKSVPIARVNNQRLSAGDTRSRGHGTHRPSTDRFWLLSLLILTILAT